MRLVSYNHNVMLDAGETMYAFDGTPYRKPATLQAVDVTRRDVPCLFDWQRDPGHYGPHYAIAELTAKGETFVAGGSWLFITAWAKEHGATISPHVRIVDDRNHARNQAEVAW